MRSQASDPVARLPHRGVARLVDRVVEQDANGLTCACRVPADSPFATGRHAPSFLAIEMAAQAAALLEIGAGTLGEAPRLGYLVRVRRASFAGALVPVEHPLSVRVRRTGAAPPLFRYDAEMSIDGEPWFTGSISTFVE